MAWRQEHVHQQLQEGTVHSSYVALQSRAARYAPPRPGRSLVGSQGPASTSSSDTVWEGFWDCQDLTSLKRDTYCDFIVEAKSQEDGSL